MRRVTLTLLLSVALAGAARAQTCDAVLAGRVVDEHDGSSLQGAAVYLLGAGVGGYADEAGGFSIAGLCPGPDTLRVTHVGCAPVVRPVRVGSASARTLRVTLEHHAELLEAIEVHAHANLTAVSDIGATLSGEQLDRTSGADFSDVVAALPGVREVSTGAGIGRPLVDGLGGARVRIVQGGIALATQDWGDEHAPEIDPFGTANVQLARGGGTVLYGRPTTGASLVLDDPAIPSSEVWTGRALLHAAANAPGGGAGLSVARRLDRHWGVRARASASLAGDARAPDYVLSNTGTRRAGGQARVYYTDGGLDFDLGYRAFAGASGILRAAHVGNADDLARALRSDRPLVVRDFTFDIDAPRQTAVHHWLTANAAYRLRAGARLELSYSAQLNRRREYDVRRGGRSARPSLGLDLATHDVRAVYAGPSGRTWQWSVGLAGQRAENRNDPTTGTSDFLPYYDEQAGGLFASAKRVGAAWTVEASARADVNDTRAQWRLRDERGRDFVHAWQRTVATGTATLGAARFYANGLSVRARLAYGSRAPNAAERFADGVHHALAVIEQGDTTLGVEHGVKLLTGVGLEREGSYGVHVAAYVQAFEGFVYQRYRDRPVVTVRGAFPVVEYEQSGDVVLAGVDLDAHVPLGPFRIDGGGAFQYGQIGGDGAPLPDVAPWRANAELSYGATRNGALKDYRLAIGVEHVGRQGRAPRSLPRAAPPAYTLTGLEASGHVAVGGRTLGVHLRVANLLNVSYRDYLDRLRFYAARPGRDVALRLLYEF